MLAQWYGGMRFGQDKHSVVVAINAALREERQLHNKPVPMCHAPTKADSSAALPEEWQLHNKPVSPCHCAMSFRQE